MIKMNETYKEKTPRKFLCLYVQLIVILQNTNH